MAQKLQNGKLLNLNFGKSFQKRKSCCMLWLVQMICFNIEIANSGFTIFSAWYKNKYVVYCALKGWESVCYIGVVRDCCPGVNILLWYFSYNNEYVFVRFLLSLQADSVLLFWKTFPNQKQKSFPKKKNLKEWEIYKNLK